MTAQARARRDSGTVCHWAVACGAGRVMASLVMSASGFGEGRVPDHSARRDGTPRASRRIPRSHPDARPSRNTCLTPPRAVAHGRSHLFPRCGTLWHIDERRWFAEEWRRWARLVADADDHRYKHALRT